MILYLIVVEAVVFYQIRKMFKDAWNHFLFPFNLFVVTIGGSILFTITPIVFPIGLALWVKDYLLGRNPGRFI